MNNAAVPYRPCLLDSCHEPTDEQLAGLMRQVASAAQDRCPCSGCKAAADEKLVSRFYDALKWAPSEPVLFDQLLTMEKLILSALMAHPDEDEMIRPILERAPDAAPALLPNHKDSCELLEFMLGRTTLFPVPRRNLRSAIEISGGSTFVKYGYFHWLPNVGKGDEDNEVFGFDDLKSALAVWFQGIKTAATGVQMREVLQMVRAISASEAWRSLSEVCDALKFNGDPRGGKLEQLITQHSIKFTPGQFHYFCSKAVRDGYLAYKEGRANSLSHAINMVPWRMERLLDRCEAEQWTVKASGEPRLQCRLEMLVTEILCGNLGMSFSLTTHSPLQIEAAMREAGYLAPVEQEPAPAPQAAAEFDE